MILYDFMYSFSSLTLSLSLKLSVSLSLSLQPFFWSLSFSRTKQIPTFRESMCTDRTTSWDLHNCLPCLPAPQTRPLPKHSADNMILTSSNIMTMDTKLVENVPEIPELIEKKNKSMRKGRHKGDREKNRVRDMPTEFPAAKASMVKMHLVIYIHKHVCI